MDLTQARTLIGSTAEVWPDDTGEGAPEDGRVVDVVWINDHWHLVVVLDG